MEKVIEFDSIDKVISVFGEYDKNIKQISNEFGVEIISRGEMIKIAGQEGSVLMAKKVIENLVHLLNNGDMLNDQNVSTPFLLSKTALTRQSSTALTVFASPPKANP